MNIDWFHIVMAAFLLALAFSGWGVWDIDTGVWE